MRRHSIFLAAVICLVGSTVLAQTERVYQSAHAVSSKEVCVLPSPCSSTGPISQRSSEEANHHEA